MTIDKFCKQVNPNYRGFVAPLKNEKITDLSQFNNRISNFITGKLTIYKTVILEATEYNSELLIVYGKNYEIITILENFQKVPTTNGDFFWVGYEYIGNDEYRCTVFLNKTNLHEKYNLKTFVVNASDVLEFNPANYLVILNNEVQFSMDYI